MTATAAWILDTNIVSEMMLPNPSSEVVDFIDQINPEEIGLATISVWEILNGIRKLDLGRRRDELTERFYSVLNEVFIHRIYDWTFDHAQICAQIMEDKRRRGESLDDHLQDAIIASTARYFGLTIVTRNVSEFRNTGVKTVNPWV